MKTVLVTPREVAAIAAEFRPALEAAGLQLVLPPAGEANILTNPELDIALRRIDATIAGSEPYTAELFAAHPTLQAVARVGVGYDSVDVPAATDAGVVVLTAPGTNHESVAEHVLALILGLTRKIVDRTNAIRAGGWPRHYSGPLRGRVLGLAGLGRIGQAVAVRGLAFGMKVIAFDPFLNVDRAEKLSVRLVPWEELLATSDFLSLHLPSTPETRHIINPLTLKAMKPTAVLINTARGGLVDESALVAALAAGSLGGAGLDVLEEEPSPANHPLFEFDNVILTPHAAGVDVLSLADMARKAANGLSALARGDWPGEQIVNPAVKLHPRWANR